MISAKKDQGMDVGFIGLGHMGAPMARNLLKAGHRVTVYNRTPGKAEALAREGAQVAGRVADACHGDVLITMLRMTRRLRASSSATVARFTRLAAMLSTSP
jgi:3-hydroxyisobutyrate dehydrogenase-like beta-hydroxyacid dehydrogenase